VSEFREVGLGLQTDKRSGRYAELGRLAEDAGFDVVTTFHDLFFQPALPALLEIAAATSRIRIGPSCLNPYTLHPVEIAGQIAALDAASCGRAFLGLAAGAWLDDAGIEQRRLVATLSDAWSVVSRLLAGDDSGFEGTVFNLKPGRRLAYPVTRTAVPLLVGTRSPRLTGFAAANAQELKLGGTANPAVVRLTSESVAATATASGRAADEVGVVAGAVTVCDLDGNRARARALEEVAMYLVVVARFDPTTQIEPELLDRIDSALADGRSAAGRLVPDDMLDRFAFAGTPAAIAEQAEALYDAGARRVDFGTPHGIDEREGVRLLGAEVLPRIAPE